MSVATIAAILLPLAPLDDSSLGDAGWFIGAAIVLFAYGVALRLLRYSRGVTANEMLALNYVAVVLIVVLMWLYGAFPPYAELLLLPVLTTAAVHPPRRVLVFVVFTGIALASPLIYADDQTVAEELARFLLWSGLAIAATSTRKGPGRSPGIARPQRRGAERGSTRLADRPWQQEGLR